MITNIPEVRPHPQGGHTVAVPVSGTLTARIYSGQYSTPAAALEAAREIGRREGELLLTTLLTTLRSTRAA